MENLKIIGAIIGLAAYLPLWIGIIKNKIRLSLTTYWLWGMLDFIAAVTIILSNGKDFWLPFGYSFGSFATGGLLLFKKSQDWKKLDTVITIMVFITIAVWHMLGTKAGIIASVSALCIAGIPQIVMVIKNPEETPTFSYLLFTTASLCSVIGAKSFTIEELLFSGSATVLCLGVVLLSLRKPQRKILPLHP